MSVLPPSRPIGQNSHISPEEQGARDAYAQNYPPGVNSIWGDPAKTPQTVRPASSIPGLTPMHKPLPPPGHPHADLMQMYAEDAKLHMQPWLLWEYSENCAPHEGWRTLIRNPSWGADTFYRRKPKIVETILLNGMKMPAPLRVMPERGTPVFRINSTEASTSCFLWNETTVYIWKAFQSGLLFETESDAKLWMLTLLSLLAPKAGPK